MLYYLFEYLQNTYDFPGAGLFQYISFRAAMAIITSLLVSLVFGGKIINIIRNKQIGEQVRELGLAGEESKKGTPTMGGLIILASIIIPTLLVAKLDNVYIIVMLIATIGLGGIGFLDDYLKIKYKNKDGLAGKFKIVGQIGIGLFIAVVLYFSDNTTVRHKVYFNETNSQRDLVQDQDQSERAPKNYVWKDTKDLKTTIPFVKNNEFDYAWLLSWLGHGYAKYAWIVFFPLVILIVTSVSNGANMTDGLDGLATGTSAIIGVTLGILAYLSGNYIFADYLNIMYIPNSGELVVFIAAFVGACVGFLWYLSLIHI